jgi:hypothetical protein
MHVTKGTFSEKVGGRRAARAPLGGHQAEKVSAMITSVTSATMTATSAVTGWGVALGAGGILLVIGLLIAMELLGAGTSGWQRSLRSALKVATAPLLVVFAVGIAARVAEILATG